MQVNLGEVIAECPRCGGTEFAAPEPAQLDEWSDLLCAACEAPTTAPDLILKIANRAMAAARARLVRG